MAMRALAVALILLAGAASAGEVDDLAAGYCAAALAKREPGAGLFTSGLIEAIVDARARHDAYDVRLPISELDLDAACAVNGVEKDGLRTLVEIERAVPDDPASDWYDTLVVIETPAGLRIDDIRFGLPDSTLRAALLDPSIRVLAE